LPDDGRNKFLETAETVEELEALIGVDRASAVARGDVEGAEARAVRLA
jgi:hypothetical protein